MNGFCFLQDIAGKLDKGCNNTKCSGGYMYIETGVVKIAFKKKAPFFNKAEIFTKRKIREGIINKEKTESGYRHPEQHLGKNLRRLLKGENPCVLHTAGL